jgi:hypothetical protein
MICSRPKLSQPFGCSACRQPGDPIDAGKIVLKETADAKITPADLSIAKAQGALAYLRG